MGSAWRLLATIAFAGVAGCAPQGAVEGPVPLGRTAYVGGPRVVPERVVEDSRCPPATQCIWAGRFVLRVTVLGGAWRKRIDLTLGEPVAVADGRLTLVAVTPVRAPDRMRFTFAFEGGL